MRFAQNQHKIGYGDESWATDSMMRNQSIQQQYHPGNLSFWIHELGTGRIILGTDKEKDEQNDLGCSKLKPGPRVSAEGWQISFLAVTSGYTMVYI